MLLRDGKLLSWDEEAIRVWNDQLNGESVECPIEERFQLDSDQLDQWERFKYAEYFKFRLQPNFAGVGGVRSSFIAPTNSSGQRVYWHADAEVTARHLNPNGTLISTLEGGPVCFLKLYHGSQRIDLNDLEHFQSTIN